MRKTRVINFYYQNENNYDPDYNDDDEPKLVGQRYANVTDVGTNRSVELLGRLDANGKVIRLEQPIEVEWTFLTIDSGSIRYRLETLRSPLKGTTLIVGEDNG